MWIFTRYGFYSIACARLQNGRIDLQKMMVRARQRRHLENLIARFPVLAQCGIRSSDNNDYRYRIIVSKAVWKEVIGELAEEQSWSNFKGETERFLRRPDEYVHALHRVWGEMLRLQEKESGS